MPGWMRTWAAVATLLLAVAAGAGWGVGGGTVRPLVEATTTLTAVADGYVYSAVSEVGIGGSEHLPVAINDAGYGEAWAVMRFDVSTLPSGATISAATLRVTAAAQLGPVRQTLRISEAQVPWTEDDLTWNTFGGARGEAVGSFNLEGQRGTDRQYGVDVTDWVRAWLAGTRLNNGFIIAQSEQAPGQNVARIWAREKGATLGPQLVITYDAPPAPTPTAAATSTPALVVLPTATPTATPSPTPTPTATPRPAGPTKLYLPALLKNVSGARLPR